MKSVVLTPYCPIPADTGGKIEIWKHLQVLRELGPCRIVSAARRPVGGGWTPDLHDWLTKQGYDVVLREDTSPGWTAGQALGMAYGAFCKGLGLERAFGHANPYHRHAFPSSWWQRAAEGADLAVFNYSYWCWLPCRVPKALALHDLWSDFMWGGTHREAREIAACDHTFVISLDEVERLNRRGVSKVSWCPPAIPKSDVPLPPDCAMVGSANLFNIEGLRWLESAGGDLSGIGLRVYGALAGEARHPSLRPVGPYKDTQEPYRNNGVFLFTTIQGMGLQIKTIEALAAGRVLIARRGAIRGVPQNENAWIEVDSPAEAVAWVRRLQENDAERNEWAAKARTYYDRHLDASRIRMHMKSVYEALASGKISSYCQ